jgi:signal peptidase I
MQEVQPPISQSPVDPVTPSRRENIRSILGTILLFIAAPLTAIFLTMFVFQSYEVDGPSMQYTLENQDRLIVLKLPRTFARITGKAYIPKRNDIIVFNKQSGVEGASEGDKQLIKRVIGLPGERVVVKDGRVTIYNKENPTGFDPDNFVPSTANDQDTPGNVDVTVPDKEVFVIGDNRTNSLDSRYFGTVPDDKIVGKLVFRLLPFNKIQSF